MPEAHARHSESRLIIYFIYGHGCEPRPLMSLYHDRTTGPKTDSETFVASRCKRGNIFLPTSIGVTPLHVRRVKTRLFGNTEERIAISQVASVLITTGVIWSQIRIE